MEPHKNATPSAGRPSFLESSLRLSPARSSVLEATAPGRRTLVRTGLPQGRLCRQLVDAAQGESDDPPNWHRLVWQRVGDTLAHRVMIQAPQPWLRPWPTRKHRGSPAPIGLTPNRQPLICTWERWTGRCIQQTVAARKSTRSLISYWAQPDGTPTKAGARVDESILRVRSSKPVTGQARRHSADRKQAAQPLPGAASLRAAVCSPLLDLGLPAHGRTPVGGTMASDRHHHQNSPTHLAKPPTPPST